jgi:Holliday junction resolvasome RuvABC endonuclease subunit
LKNWMLAKIQQYHEHQVEVVLEEIQEQSNAQTFKKLAMLQGVLLVTLEESSIKYHLVYASQWKSYLKVAGASRTIQKRNAQAYVLETYGKSVTQDEADAICIGRFITQSMKNWGP